MTNPRTIPFRRLLAAAVAACFALVALPAAGNAAYKKPAEGHYIATLKGSQTSTWFKPRANGTITCFGTTWVEGDGAPSGDGVVTVVDRIMLEPG